MKFFDIMKSIAVLILTTSVICAADNVNFAQTPMAAGKAALAEDAYYINRVLGVANFSPDLRMPLQLFYSSASEKTGIFGYAWNCPQLESRVITENDGAVWTTPWGEKVRFFAKQKATKDTLELYKEEMKGAKPFFAPYSDWEAEDKQDGKEWFITGKKELDGWRFHYKESQLQSVTAPSGRSLSFEYSKGKIKSVRQENEAFIELEYSNNFVSSITINGIESKFAYSSATVEKLPESLTERPLKLSKPVLASYSMGGLAPIEFAYDKNGYLSQVKHGEFTDNISVQYETLDQRMANLKAKADKKLKHSGVVSGRILSDSFFTYSYNGADKPGKLNIKNKNGETASYDYAQDNGILKVTDFSGRTNTIYYYRRYDVAYNGKIREIVDGKDRVVANYRYDKLSGNLVRFRDMLENETFFQYDKKDRLEFVEKRASDSQEKLPVAKLSYSGEKNPVPAEISVLGPDGKPVVTTTISCNNRNQPVRISNGQSTTTIAYNKFGYPVSVTNAFNMSGRTEYDKYNRVVSSANPFGVTTNYTYAKSGLVTRIEQLDGKEVLSFLEVKYDNLGQPVSYTDHKGREKKFERNAFGQVVKEMFPDETSVEYSYDAVGRLTQVLDQNRHEIKFDWSKFGLEGKTTAEGQLTDYTYDRYGLLKTVASKSGANKKDSRVIGYEHDKLDRVVKVSYTNGEIETFAYDPWGRLSEASRGDKKATFKYDYFGRVIEKTEGALANKYAYNNYGQRTSRTTVNGTVTLTETTEYDKFGRISKVKSGDKIVEYKYNDKNQLVAQIVNGVPIEFEYTKYGQLKKKVMGGDSAFSILEPTQKQ